MERKTNTVNKKTSILITQNNGITLISLIITIIILLILATVAISIAIDSNGLFARARKVAEDWNTSVINEEKTVENVFEILNEVNVGGVIGGGEMQPPTVEVQSIILEPTSLSLKEGETAEITATIIPANATNKTVTWCSDDDGVATVKDNGNGTATVTAVKEGTTNIVVKTDGKEEKCSVEVKLSAMFTKENVKDYLGKVVTNFRPSGTVTNSAGTFTVGTTYRLYYVDFDNKYGDGAGTIYLKADCTNQGYRLPIDKFVLDSTKVKKLNPELYKATSLDEESKNMKAVKWLLDPNNWETLKTSNSIYKNDPNSINYVVGAPSVEMMMDSYNTYYEEEIKEEQEDLSQPDIRLITAGHRRKLFYKCGEWGYQIGPSTEGTYYYGYGFNTLDNSVYGDSNIGELYCPASGHNYYLASPSNSYDYVLYVSSLQGGWITNCRPYDYSFALCPLVSLKPTTQLEFAN